MAGGSNWWTVVGMLSLLVVAVSSQEVVRFSIPSYTLHVVDGELCDDTVSLKKLISHKVSVSVVPVNGTGQNGTDFQIEPRALILAPESQRLPIKIKLLPKGKTRSFDFNLTLHCDSLVICTSKAHVAVVQSGRGWVGFQSPPFHGFVNNSLQIWLVKNGSVPADVTVTLSNDDDEAEKEVINPVVIHFLSSETSKNAQFNITSSGTFTADLQASCVDHDQTAKVMVLEPLPNPGFQHLISDLENKIGQLQARLEDQETAQQLQARLEDQYKRQQAQLIDQYKRQLHLLETQYLRQQEEMMVSLESQLNATVDFIFARLGNHSSSTIEKGISPTPPSTSDTDTFSAPLPTPDTSNIYSTPLANNNSSADNGTLNATTAETPTTETPTTETPTTAEGDGDETSQATSEPPTNGGGMNWQLAVVAVVVLLVVAVAGYVGYYNRKKLYDWVTGRGGGGGGGGGRGGRRKHYRRLPQSVHDAMVHND